MLTVIKIAIDAVNYGMLLHLLSDKLQPRFRKKYSGAVFLGVLAILVLLQLAVDRAILPGQFQILILGVILYLYSAVARGGEMYVKLFWAFTDLVFYSVASVTAEEAGQLLGMATGASGRLEEQWLLIISVVIRTNMLGGMILFVCRKKKKQMDMPPSLIVLLTFILLLISILLVWWTDYVDSVVVQNQYLTFAQLLIAVCIGVIILLVLVLVDNVNQLAGRLLEQQAVIQQNEVTELHNDEVKAMYETMRAWRHDYSNHLQALKGFAIAGDMRKLTEYLDVLDKSVSQTKLTVDSGNTLLDAIINAKAARAKSLGIQFSAKVEMNSQVLPMMSTDVTALLGNLLDNAVEAAEIVSNSGDAMISLSVAKVNDRLIIRVKNSTDGNIKKVKGEYITRKSGCNHGIGMKQIDAIVKKYDGYIDRIAANNTFETLIYLSSNY